VSLLRRTPTPERRRALSEGEQRLALRACAMLLGHPDAELLDDLPLLRAAAAQLPPAAAAPLGGVVDHVQRTPLTQLQAEYSDTFDLRRRSCLYLTYFTHGDTRQRGMALLRFSHAYRSAGAEFLGGELPDHLAVVCEFAATSDLALGTRLLREHRAGLELVRSALAEVGSPYVGLVDVVGVVLGEASPRDRARALELSRTGPPEEEVGLEPFGPPELMGGRR
jgi:nitrate reductase delta subunit